MQRQTSQSSRVQEPYRGRARFFQKLTFYMVCRPKLMFFMQNFKGFPMQDEPEQSEEMQRLHIAHTHTHACTYTYTRTHTYTHTHTRARTHTHL